MNPNFRRAFESLIGIERGYVNDPHDPGGETAWGISKRTYPHLHIASLTLYDAMELYYRDYWLPLRLDQMVYPVAAEVFEAAVNTSGPGTVRSNGAFFLQRALNFLGAGVTEDGLIGAQTLRAVDYWSRKNRTALVKAQNGEQYRYYRKVVESWQRRGKAQPHRFAAGWMKRVEFS